MGEASRQFLILTSERLMELVAVTKQLEFRTEVFPLILAELSCRMILTQNSCGSRALFNSVCSWIATGGPKSSARDIARSFLNPQLLDPLWQILRPELRGAIGECSDAASVFLQDDIRESRLGISGSSLKHGLEVLLEARNFVKALVDYRQDAFCDPGWIYGTFSSLVNRNVIGPQHARSSEILALLQAGIVKIMPGGTAYGLSGESIVLQASGVPELPVDYLVTADRPAYGSPEQHRLAQSLVSLGVAVPFCRTDGSFIGIRVNQQLMVSPSNSKDGLPLWAIGPVCEGSSYYNNYIPCIQDDAEHPFFEADRIAQAALDRVAA
jgi:hypothetical protein